jgi:SAM-dependent methyltransferase
MAPIDPVRDQYEALPYPPRDPAREMERVRATVAGELSLASYLLWGGRRRPGPGFRVLDAGCGTGDNTVFVAEQLRGLGAEVVGLDLSAASLAVTRERLRVRGLDGVKLAQGRIEAASAAELGHFDYIISAGVLHHLPQPELGLVALRRLLAPHGGMCLMLYAPHGRRGVYDLQAVLRQLAPAGMDIEARLRITRALLGALPADHPAQISRSLWEGEQQLHGDAGLFDVLLHSTDRAFTVGEIQDWLATAGLRVESFFLPYLYEPSSYLPKMNFSRLAAHERPAVAEVLSGRMAKHVFFVLPADMPSPAHSTAEDLEAIPTWLHHDASGGIRNQLAGEKAELHLVYEALNFQLALDPFRRGFLRRVDGHKSAATILHELSASFPTESPQVLRQRWLELQQAVYLVLLLALFPPPS